MQTQSALPLALIARTSQRAEMVAGTNGLFGFGRHLRRKGGAPHLSEKAESDEACDVAVGLEAGFPLEER